MDSQYILSDLGNVYDKRMREYRLPFSIFILFSLSALCAPSKWKEKEERIFFLISIYLKSGQEGLGWRGAVDGSRLEKVNGVGGGREDLSNTFNNKD